MLKPLVCWIQMQILNRQIKNLRLEASKMILTWDTHSPEFKRVSRDFDRLVGIRLKLLGFTPYLCLEYLNKRIKVVSGEVIKMLDSIDFSFDNPKYLKKYQKYLILLKQRTLLLEIN